LFLLTGRIGLGDFTIPLRLRWARPLDLSQQAYWAKVIGSGPIADHYKSPILCQCCDDNNAGIEYSDLCSKVNDVWSACDGP